MHVDRTARMQTLTDGPGLIRSRVRPAAPEFPRTAAAALAGRPAVIARGTAATRPPRAD